MGYVNGDEVIGQYIYDGKLLILNDKQPNYENLEDNAIINPVNAGTYNYYKWNNKKHQQYDVDPYIEWGNCPTDTSTKEQRQSVLTQEELEATKDLWSGMGGLRGVNMGNSDIREENIKKWINRFLEFTVFITVCFF